MNLTVDALKQLAAGVVAGFTIGGTPLNEGIIKVASDNQFNPEQIKRLVEASNQIAYLHKMAETTDRTFEFEVANYDEVINSFLTTDGMSKQASASKGSPLDIVMSDVAAPMEKKASDATVNSLFSDGEKLKMLESQFYSGRAKLEDMHIESHNIAESLIKQANMLKQDPEALDKIAQFCGADATKYNEINRLVFGHVKEASSIAARGLNVMSVKSLHDTLMMAKQANQEMADLESNLVKAAEVLDSKIPGLTKEAGIFSMASKAFKSLSLPKASSAKLAPTSTASIRNKATGFKDAVTDLKSKVSPGAKTALKGIGAGTAATFGGIEVAQISAGSRPKNDVWKSLHS